MDPEEYRRKIEKEIRRLMEDKLTSGTMSASRANEIADYILSTLHPHMTLNQIHELSKNFDEHFSELVPIVHEIQRDYDNRINEAVTHHVSKLLKDNKIEEAHNLLKQATSGELKLKD
jgi:transcription termination factor NusB